MKILHSSAITPFGGLNFVIEEAVRLNIKKLFEDNLPELPKQSRYTWFDLLMSYWSVFFCGGDCAEDLAINLRKNFQGNPLIKIPSPDRVLERVKSLSVPSDFFGTARGNKEHHFSLAEQLNPRYRANLSRSFL